MVTKYFRFFGRIYRPVIYGAVFSILFFSSIYPAFSKGPIDFTLSEAIRFDCGFKLDDMKPRMTVHGDTICYYGEMNYVSFSLFKKNLSPRIKFVVIRSSGGEAYYSVEIGKLFDRFQPTIIVDRICASGCAYFLFLAADKKVIKKNSFVGFHGGVPETRAEAFAEGERRKFNKLPPDRQAKFWQEFDNILSFQKYLLSRTGVNKDLIYWDPNKRIRKDILAGCRPPNNTIWAPSPKTLKSFGVKGLIYAWYPASYKDMFKFGKRHSSTSCLVP